MSIIIRRNATTNSVTIDGKTYDLSKMGKPGKKRVHKKVMGKARAKYGWED